MRVPCAAVAVLALVLGSGCAGQQAIKTRRHAELSIGVSLLGVLAGGLAIAALPSEKPVLIPITAVFGGLAVVSAIVYGVAYSNSPPDVPPPAPPPPPDHRGEAWALTQEAQSAARAGNCDRVVALSIQVQMLDADFLASVFLRDAAIARCTPPR